jgi:glycosyltransferase involved in cell wall biosynthesis
MLIEARVKFIGRADRATAVGLFRGCEFFVLPSRQEPLGIVNLEAMAAGKAVIASRTGGVPEIVTDGETGLLVPPGDAAALAGALRRLTGDTALRECLADGGRERVKAFAWEAIAGSYREIYEAALAGSGRAETGMDPARVPLLNAE